MSLFKKLGTLASVVAISAAFVSASVVAAPQAQAATCNVYVTKWEAKNINCPFKIRHYDTVKSGATYYASWVSASYTSSQGMRYANLVSYWFQSKG